MIATLKDAFGKLKLGDPLFVRNLVIYPLSDGQGIKTRARTLDEGIGSGTVSVSELEIPSINEVILDNAGDEPLFLLDGDELFGAQQARVTTTAALIEARSGVHLPVACIEEGRWSGTRRFEGSFSSTHPRLRSILCSGVNDSLRSNKSFQAPQRLVWDEVGRELSSLKVSSATSSFHDLATTLAFETERYALDSQCWRTSGEGARGMIVTAGRDLLGLEYSDDTRLFQRLVPRMLRGYALSALERRSVSNPPAQKELERLVEQIQGMKPLRYPGIAVGEEWRFGNDKLVGRALVTKEGIIEAAFFPALN